tara:strand:+ start:2015 stop:2215 length:201 start_codon:yes stop_codon:yes gene_type:complete
MKLIQKITFIVLGFIVTSLAFAHEGLHAAGQVHAGESHIGLLEVALAVVATVLLVAYQLKKHKPKK